MNGQYDRGPPIKILHKYPEKDPASTTKALYGMRSLRGSHLCVFSGVLLHFVRQTCDLAA